MKDFESDAAPAPRSPLALSLIAVLGALGVGALAALGAWQIERRSWKLDLIQRIDSRIHAAPVAAPGRAEWPAINRAEHEYRRVSATGVFLHNRETLVRAVTERGPGFWVITPLRAPNGAIVLVNRGFVPPEQRDRAVRSVGEVAGETTVTGLLRMTEPGGMLLQSNDPAADRWFSRDVVAIAVARRLDDVAPYFIDAASSAPGGPVGGLTVVAFPNNHLVYALTWFTLALMVAGGTAYVVREEWRARGAGGSG